MLKPDGANAIGPYGLCARITGHEKILAAPGRIDPPARIIHPGSNPGFIIYRVLRKLRATARARMEIAQIVFFI